MHYLEPPQLIAKKSFWGLFKLIILRWIVYQKKLDF